jgi:phage tail sheath gpL-like
MGDPLSIPLTGLASNDPVPGTYLQIDFAQGAPSGPGVTYGALLMGNKLSTGLAVLDTVVYGPFGDSPLPLVTEQDAITLFGQGSELHRMWKRFVKKNQSTPVYAIAITESSGAKATLVITFATTATANGNVRLWVGDDFVDTAITSGDTPTVIAANVVASVATRPDWAVTAGNVAGVLTLSARQKGPRGNWLRGSAVVTGTGVGTTSDTVSQVFFTGGTTADSNAAALATIAPTRYYYLVPAAEDATQLGALSTQVNTQALPTGGIRQKIIAASVDTEGNAQTIAIALNQARAEYVWMQNADRQPSEIAADMAALYSLGELPDGIGAPSRHNFDGLGGGSTTLDGLWDMPPARSGTKPTRTTIKGALNNGLSPIATTQLGKTYLVMRCTTRSLTNGANDYRVRDPHKVTILDFYGDALVTTLSEDFGGKDIIDNPVNNQVPKSDNVVWPNTVKATVNHLTEQWGDDGQFQNVDQMKADTKVIRESVPATRLSMRIPAQPIDVLHQIGIQLLQVA